MGGEKMMLSELGFVAQWGDRMMLIQVSAMLNGLLLRRPCLGSLAIVQVNA
jgi:hypothetical protein